MACKFDRIFLLDVAHFVKIDSQLVGIIAYVERFMMEAEDRGNMAFHRLLQKQHQRMMGLHKKQLVGVSLSVSLFND
jgi:hypothetical protein